MKTNQKGVAHQALVLVIVLIAAITGAAWSIHKRNNNDQFPSDPNAVVVHKADNSRPTPARPLGPIQNFVGTSDCLQHIHDTGTAECAIAIRTDDGKYYGIDADDSLLYKLSGRIRITGILEPPTSDKLYKSDGRIYVLSIDKP